MRLSEAIGPDDHVIGKAHAPVELVEYGDYECPYCARAHHEMTEVLRRTGKDIRYAYRHFPLTDIHPRALLAAQAAEAAGAQGRFWPMHSVIFENRGHLELEDLVVYAETIGLDAHRFARDLRSGTYVPRVQRDFRTGVHSGVKGTPAFFVDGAPQSGTDAESLVTEIRRALSRREPRAAHR